MTDNKKNFISKLNSIYIVVLGCLLGSILIFNSDYVNNQKASTKLNQEKANLFNRIISKRGLEENPAENDEEIYETDEVCSHASDELQKYYQTGVLSDIDLDNGAIKCEEKNEEYMQALINTFKSLVDDDSSGTDNGDRRNLRNLLNDDGKENITKYLSSRILPMLIFLGISALSIIGWIICCFCCCCNCCCCCCCKKPGCKVPCLIFSYVFYALVVACSIYGLTQATKIFVGLADAECSLLQFFDQIIYGENKDDNSPKWIGIEEVSQLLDDLEFQINDMKQYNMMDQLDSLKGEVDFERNNFKSLLNDAYKKFYKSETPLIPIDKYCVEYNGQEISITQGNSQVNKKLDGKYVLDLIPMIKKLDGTDGLISIWKEEIDDIDGGAGQVISDASGSFQTIIDKLPTITDSVDKGKKQMSKLKKPFDSVYNDISEILYDISDYSDKKGKITVNLVFGVLAFMNICLAVLMLFICMFSGKSCVDCGFCRCIFKFASHILWNILAILMILSFAVGSILALVGRVGGDLMSFISFLLSEENFNSPNKVLLDKLGPGQKFLRKCIIDDGNLADEFGLSPLASDFNTVNQAKTSIDSYTNEFKNLYENYPAYNILKDALKDKIEFKTDTSIISVNPITPGSNIAEEVRLSDIIKSLNDSIGTTTFEKWNQYEGDRSFKCDDGLSQSNPPEKLHPYSCEPNDREWISSSSAETIKYAQITTDIIQLLKNADGTKGEGQSYFEVINDLKAEYKDYLNGYLDLLGFFGEVTDDLISILQRGIGNSENAFSFLNGKFIQTNLKIILKYLKYSLGKDFYTVGLCLLIIGCSLVLSISSTILLIVIINADVENNKKLAENTEIPNYPASNDGRIVEFKY